ncbi:MAG: alginate lyase family protein [Thermoleophilia bacterium]
MRELGPALAWKLRRLAAMSPGEVAARVGREARHGLDDAVHDRARPLWERRWSPPPARLLAGPAPDRPLGFLVAERAALVSERDPAAAGSLVALAERVLAGRIRYFGYPELELARPVDFSLDLTTGRRWPDRHGKRLDYRHEGIGDPKWIWELNRLQEAPVLAQAWLLTGEERFARGALAHVGAWLDGAAPGRGIAWSNGYEGALRAISLAVALDALRGAPALDRAAEERLLVALWQHGRWIERDPSTHSSANNHLIGELVGLSAIGLLAPELRDAARWREAGLAGLAREASLQVLDDGLSAEQAFRYHLYVLDHLLVVTALCDAQGAPPPRPELAALGRSADALAAQLGDGEPDPTYGDADDGRVVRLDDAGVRGGRALAGALAARLGHAGARRAPRAGLDAAAPRLTGLAGAARFDATEPAPAPGSGAARRGRPGGAPPRRRALVVDAGPLGHLSIAAHGHADALQATLEHDGEELVVDPGVGSYFARPDLRAAFRGTGFHPTVEVDGRDQSEPGGPFLWRRHARARVLLAGAERGVLVGEHDGYAALADPVTHRRAVCLLDGGALLVVDRLLASGRHRHRQVWPLHPALALDPAALAAGADVRATRDGAPRLLVALAASAPFDLLAARGETDPPRGWWSPRLESFEPAWHLWQELEADGPRRPRRPALALRAARGLEPRAHAPPGGERPVRVVRRPGRAGRGDGRPRPCRPACGRGRLPRIDGGLTRVPGTTLRP